MFAWILLSAALSSAFAAPTVVVIDPGHGGKDKGTHRKNVFESEITLKVAQRLHALLQSDRRFRPVLTRLNEHGVSLSDRARLAKTEKADVFLSIHVNSSPDTRARGAEFYFQNQLQPDEESMFLAHKENGGEADTHREAPTYDFLDRHSYAPEINSIVADLLNGDRVWRSSGIAKALKQNWRGSRKSKSNSVRQAPFFVLSQMTTPSTLVELGFLTNADDFTDLTTEAKLNEMADDLYRGLKVYKDSLDKAVPAL